MAVGYLISKIHNRRLRFTNLKEDTKSLLQDTGLFGRGRAKKRGTLIPLLHFKPGDSKKFAGYTQDHFANKPRPSMSPAVTEKFFEGIDEIFSNAELHSKTQFGMFACGQVLPRQSRLNFSIVDMGIGFQEVIRRSLGRDMGPAEVIDWAMKGRNTTRSGDIPGGLGLKILKAFIGINCGKLSVVSHHGYWRMQESQVVLERITPAFPGTAVTIEVNTSDKRSYRMATEATGIERSTSGGQTTC